jgi:zinc transport system substrate-binding protein
MPQRLPSLLAPLLCLLLLSPQSHAEIHLLTSIKPLQLIASAHYYVLRPSDLRRVQEADLLYWIGPDMESFLPRVLSSRSKPSVAVQALPQMTLRHFTEEQAEEHAPAGEHAHADSDEHDHAHRPGSLDAHLWLLPANARVIANTMATDLAQIDPSNAARYQANLRAFERRLESLEPHLRATLEPLTDKPFFVFHEAFEYFEAAYGLRHAGVFSISGEVQPGARHVALMRERLQHAGPSCVFSEPPLRPRLADTLMQGLPVTLAELDSMGLSVPVNAVGYEKLLQNLAEGLSQCLSKL